MFIEYFANFCRILDSDDIYVLYEEFLTDAQKAEVLAFAADGSAEPVRDALNKIGVKYDVVSLKNY